MRHKANMVEVPSFVTNEYRARQSEFCIIIPVINEGERIKNQLLRMKSCSSEFDIIIADGGSTDGSLEDSFLSDKIRSKLVKTGEGKLSAQMRMALKYALDQGYQGFIFIDGNNKDNPVTVVDFAKKLNEGYDHVQGSRFIPGGKHQNTPFSRLLAIKLIHAPMISLASRFRYTDTTNGFRAYSRKFICDKRVQPFRSVFSRYELHYYLAIRAARLGFKVIEVPVERVYPREGKTPTKISGYKGLWLVFITLFKACMGFYDPKVKE